MGDASTIAAVVGGLNMVVTLLGGGILIGTFKARLDRVEKDVRDTKGLLVSAAVEADRLRRAESDIDRHEQTIDGLRRGVGFINDPNARTVNREY